MQQIWQRLSSRLEEAGLGLIEAVPDLLAALIVVLVTWVLARVVRRAVVEALHKRVSRKSFVDLCRHLSYIGVWLTGLLVATMVAVPSLTLGQLVGVVGLGSVAIGFAFKDIFENFFAGVLILWRFPFDNDDVIECEGIRGRVEEVTVRMTLIRRLDGVLVAMPNAVLFKNPVTVLTSRSQRRVSVISSVAYGENVDEARETIRRAVESCSSVREEPSPEVMAKEFSASSIDFLVRWWTDPVPGDEHRSRDEVVATIKRDLEDAGIEIPLPQRVVTIRDEQAERARVTGS